MRDVPPFIGTRVREGAGNGPGVSPRRHAEKRMILENAGVSPAQRVGAGAPTPCSCPGKRDAGGPRKGPPRPVCEVIFEAETVQEALRTPPPAAQNPPLVASGGG